MLLLRSLLFDALLYGLLGTMGLLLAPAAALSRDAARWGIRTYCRIVLALLAAVAGLRTEVRGRVPAGDCLVAAKHQSFLDVLVLAAVLPRPRFVMKAELAAMPVFGWYARRIGCVTVERAKRGAAMRGMLAALDAGEGGQIVIYPQGTRVAPGAAESYKPGTALLYARFGLPCVPAATNAGLFWGRRSLLRRPGCAVVEFLAPVAPGLPVRAFMAEIETRIEAASETLMAEARR